MLKKLGLMLVVVLLVACSQDEVVQCKDLDGNIYDTVEFGGSLWITSNFKASNAIDHHENMEVMYYSAASLEDDSFIPDGWRLPNKSDLDSIISLGLDEVFDETGLNLTLDGMYDFTGVYQWIDESVLIIGEEDNQVLYLFYDTDKNTFRYGDFHPDDSGIIRLIKDSE